MYFSSEGSRPFICQVLFVIRWLIKVTVMLALFIISSELEYPCRTSETRAGVRDRQVSIRLGGRGGPPPHCSSPSPLPMHIRPTIQYQMSHRRPFCESVCKLHYTTWKMTGDQYG